MRSPTPDVRLARRDELARVRDFYAGWGYRGQVTDEARVFVAEVDEQLVGLVRLESERGVTVLRGMRVNPAQQRRGIGTALLDAVVADLRETRCYCIPYTHLLHFYGRVGFADVAPLEAPEFLRHRLMDYRARGVDAVMMRRG